jgi:hypothetical protein
MKQSLVNTVSRALTVGFAVVSVAGMAAAAGEKTTTPAKAPAAHAMAATSKKSSHRKMRHGKKHAVTRMKKGTAAKTTQVKP